ncbi:MAG: formamidopyrimidine-DNA glycosylase [Acidimicrobiia bacterium]|nr:formamidopyrimidine-DNA glycosylase [Acidimicrobiia bacterium]
MPEIIEVEAYRRAISATEGRRIAAVHAPDQWYAKGGTTTDALRLELTGACIEKARRIGKLVIVDTDGPRLGLRFGMTGKIVVDGAMPIDHLLYDSPRHEPAWDRFGLEFDGGGAMVLRDPRRLGGVQLDPDESHLGPDALSLTLGQLRKALGPSTVALKARLLDQRRVAGLGNLLVDEALWRARLSPIREAGSLDDPASARLHRFIRTTLRVLGQRGGSHTGDLQPARVRGGCCPRDGAVLRRDQVGGRTTYWCPEHQS